MEEVFRNISERTGGDVYIGVVGGVRTGKSTFIRRFMELMVIPNIQNVYDRERARDELPQAGAGKTVTTTEPKFVPNEAVEVVLDSGIRFRVRLVDCVGYRVPGALGYEEEDLPRLVTTPWFDEPIPFDEAAEVGTRKVIQDHSTIGIVMTTDGTITDLSRENYVEAEERVIQELKDLNKPFVVILNSIRPHSLDAVQLAAELTKKYNVPVLPMDVEQMKESDVKTILEEVLYEFPVSEVNISLPLWVNELGPEHWLRQHFETAVRETVKQVHRVRDIQGVVAALREQEHVKEVQIQETDLGSGTAAIKVTTADGLFHQVLSEVSGFSVEGDQDILRLMRELSSAKREYDKVAAAIQEVRKTGYGIVTPRLEEMNLEEPELIRQGSRFGVRLRASAPSVHMIRADITTEITPIIGTEKQCEELVRYILTEFEENPKKIWDSEIFGKSLHDLVREGIQNKLYRMPENAQAKLQETLQRIVNDGSGGLICIII